MERLNPVVKAAAILAGALILSFTYSLMLNGLILFLSIVLLLFCSKAKKKTLVKILIPAFLAALAIFFTGCFFSNPGEASQLPKNASLNFALASISGSSFYNGLKLAARILSFAFLGILFALTTDGEEFVQSLIHQCHLSPKYAYGVLAAFHLLPVIREELFRTRLAFKVRGIPVTPFSLRPVFAMLVNTVHWSESIAMAMESKGFSGEEKRTYYHVTKVHWYDWAFFAGLVGLLLLGSFLFPL